MQERQIESIHTQVVVLGQPRHNPKSLVKHVALVLKRGMSLHTSAPDDDLPE